MQTDSVMVKCPRCGTKNRIPANRWGDDRAVCGRCKSLLTLSRLFPDRPVPVSDDTFEKEVLTFPGPMVLEFFSPWCGHCQRLAPVLEELAQEYTGRIKFATLNLDQNRRVASQNNVNGTPTLFFYRDGRIVDRVVGALQKTEIARHLDALVKVG